MKEETRVSSFVFMPSAHAQRMDRLRRLLGEARADALLVAHPPNIYYLCGFSGSAGYLLVERRKATLFTDARYTAQAREEVNAARVRIARRGLLGAAAAAVRAGGRARVAYESDRITVAAKSQLEQGAGPRIGLVPSTSLVETLRAVKDEDEIARLRDAAQLASEVFVGVLPFVKPGVREVELAAEIEYRMRRHGASGPAFETIVASGQRAALPHARASEKALRKNELVVFDLGAILHHYCSDLTRTVFVGRAPSRIRRWYQAVLEAQCAAREALRPGATAGAADAAARRVLRRFGVERYFVHSTGHGLGLEVHEEPRLARRQNKRMETGNVVTVEPGIYVPGVGGIRIEDEVWIHARGTEVLTHATREFLQL